MLCSKLHWQKAFELKPISYKSLGWWEGGVLCGGGRTVQGYLVHKKLPTPRTLEQASAWDRTANLERGAVSYERGTPVVRGGGRMRV